MTWESGPALPPGTLTLTPEQARVLARSLANLTEAAQHLAAAWAEAGPRFAQALASVLPPSQPDPDEPDPDEHASEVHLRALPAIKGDRPW